MKFFLKGVAEVSRTATHTARAIVALRDDKRVRLSGNANALRLLDFAFGHPLLTIRMAEAHLGTAYVTAANAVEQMVSAGVLREITGSKEQEIPLRAVYRALRAAGRSRVGGQPVE